MTMKTMLCAILMTTAIVAVDKIQAADTLYVRSGSLKPGVLKEGTHRYLVYFKMGKDSNRVMTQFWTRSIAKTVYADKPAIRIQQSWEDKDTVMHTTTSYCSASDLQPLYHEYWWNKRGNGVVDFVKGELVLNGSKVQVTDTARQRKASFAAFQQAQQKFVLNWHLDLETFPTLPYKTGRVFVIPFYEPGSIPPVNTTYTVRGADKLMGYDDKPVDCWILVHEEKGNLERFWISKKTKEVLKLEQEITQRNNQKMYRYKVKLAFSS
ncbi:MAG TPA: hypothetical protein DCO78_15460 [Chitinophagaceae bacterium]|nr:hypothetical protein [Chitinophagaceae bacterium]